MANNLPVKSKVIYGEEEVTKNNRPKIRTFKDLVAPQTQTLVTIYYDMIPLYEPMPERKWRGR
jgi:hypothetical protein